MYYVLTRATEDNRDKVYCTPLGVEFDKGQVLGQVEADSPKEAYINWRVEGYTMMLGWDKNASAKIAKYRQEVIQEVFYTADQDYTPPPKEV